MLSITFHRLDALTVMRAVNQGIDSCLEACFVVERGDKYQWLSATSLQCHVSDDSLPVLQRRLRELGAGALAARMESAGELDAFTRQYVETALWADLPEDDLDHDINDLAPETLATMKADCQRFQRENAAEIAADPSLAGHDFWLTRRGHGCGFWDGDWPEEIGERLTAAAESYAETNLYVGDDGKVYLE